MFFNFCHARKNTRKRVVDRRKYIRLDANIPVHYCVIPKDKEDKLIAGRTYRAETRNIGGGGLLLEIPILSDELLLTTHLINIHFSLPNDMKPIEAIARMVCVEKPEHLDGFYLRVAFVKINNDCRQRLINYIEKRISRRWR